MDLTTLTRAVVMFVATNVDDLLLLSLFFARARRRGAATRIVVGQYLGFGAILALSVAGALGAELLPHSVIPFLGLVPLALGLRAAWQAWRGDTDDEEVGPTAPGVVAVAGVTLANGGDNLGVYVPVFTTTGRAGLALYVAVFLVLVGVWCALGRFLATRAPVARALARYGHVVLPVVLIGVGLLILLGT
ncbi:cadmium resistance transporter [Actinomycetospora chiangmaiensis]|uniref:cadmium resistance transporter n=1 Tax=Actinomycetospora chiangmaiensis TaxID=402650 RepID=UPI00037A2DDC|nr:cadmium resistance transporter [Actinomycetospora chiangmaiensis]